MNTGIRIIRIASSMSRYMVRALEKQKPSAEPDRQANQIRGCDRLDEIAQQHAVKHRAVNTSDRSLRTESLLRTHKLRATQQSPVSLKRLVASSSVLIKDSLIKSAFFGAQMQ